MTLQARLSRRSRAAAVTLAVLAATAVAGAATAGTAQASATPQHLAGPALVHPMSGSGTVTDPWVPEKSATIVCDSATQFGNYTPGVGHSDPINTLYRGTQIGVRYETSDHNSVMAYYAGAVTKWGFVLRSCVQFA